MPFMASYQDRVESANRLALEISHQCPGVVILLAAQLGDTVPPREVGFARIAAALECVTRPIAIYLEDDISLADGFGAKLERVIRERFSPGPKTAVSLFSIEPRPDGYHRARMPFCYAQTLIMPGWLMREWAAALVPWAHEERTQKYHFAHDICFGEVCDANGVEILVHYPSLVQHLPMTSACGHTHCPTSPTFKG